MKKVLVSLFVLLMIFTLSGCDDNENNNENITKSAEEIALTKDGYTKKIDESTYDMKCFEDIKYHFGKYGDNILISSDGTVCLVDYEKPFLKSKKNTLIIEEKLTGTVYGAMKSYDDNKYYFLTDKEMLRLDDNYKFVSVTDPNEQNNFGFRGNEALKGIQKVNFDRIFQQDYMFFILKDNSIYSFSYVSSYEDYETGAYDYDPYSEEHKIDTSSVDEEIIDYFSYDNIPFLITNNGYYRNVLMNKDEIEKYSDAIAKYDFVKLEIYKYKDRVKFISADHIVFDNKIYEYGLF